MEANCGGPATIEGAQSSFVALPDLLKRGKRVKQFQRALRILRLRPCVHQSQLNDTAAASIDDACVLSNGGDDKDGKSKDQRQKGEDHGAAF